MAAYPAFNAMAVASRAIVCDSAKQACKRSHGCCAVVSLLVSAAGAAETTERNYRTAPKCCSCYAKPQPILQSDCKPR